MQATAGFRRQHEEIGAAARELLRDLAAGASPVDPAAMRQKLARLTGKLKVHAAMEEEALYPRLLSHENAEVRDKARELLQSVGPLYTAYFEFSARWLEAGAIEAGTSAFAREIRGVFDLLGKRMVRENTEFYPLIDALDG